MESDGAVLAAGSSGAESSRDAVSVAKEWLPKPHDGRLVMQDQPGQVASDADNKSPGLPGTEASDGDAGSAVEKSGESDTVVEQVNADGSIETPKEAGKAESRWTWGAPKVTPFDSDRTGASSVVTASLASESMSSTDVKQDDADDVLQTPIEAVVTAARYATGYFEQAEREVKVGKEDVQKAAKTGERSQTSTGGGENAPGMARVNRGSASPWSENVLFWYLHNFLKSINALPHNALWLIGVLVCLLLMGVTTCAMHACRASTESEKSRSFMSSWSSSFSIPWLWRSSKPTKTFKMANDGLLAPPKAGS